VPEPLEGWIAPIRHLRRSRAAELDRMSDREAQWRALCEWNVAAQVRALAALPVVADAWAHGRALTLHGWIYDLRDGLLKDLGVSIDRPRIPVD